MSGAGPVGDGPAIDVPAIDVRGLAVRYATAFDVVPTFKGSVRRLARRQRVTRQVHALEHVDLTVGRGEVVGVVGANGAGKSTLLRVVAGIIPPTEGEVRVTGRVSALLRPGAAFNRELTGRDNVLLGGLAIGLPMARIAERAPDILAFADVGEFVDAPLRTWSTGMVQRLGFAIAAHLDPEVLLLDEGLSAGDEAFRRRCTTHMRALAGSATTILLVSHDLGQVEALADRVVWLADGRVRAEGAPAEVIAAYRAA